MSLEEIKAYVKANRNPLIVGAVIALIVRGLIR